MMKFHPILAAVILSILGSIPAVALDLTLTVKGIRNNKGKIAALAFVDKNGFPNQATKAKARMVVIAKRGTLTLTLKNLPAGKIAVTVLHDEDANGSLNRGPLGIPLEGVGMSGKPPNNMPPSFDDVAFDLKKSQKLEITLKYR